MEDNDEDIENRPLLNPPIKNGVNFVEDPPDDVSIIIKIKF